MFSPRFLAALALASLLIVYLGFLSTLKAVKSE
jgi:hypothetical protein